MLALVLEQPAPAAESPLLLRDVARPEPGPGEIRLRVAACGVCRTDLQIAEGDLAARRLPVIPGHQIVGRVEALGSDASGWTPGDRAGVTWLVQVTDAFEWLQMRPRIHGWSGESANLPNPRIAQCGRAE